MVNMTENISKLILPDNRKLAIHETFAKLLRLLKRQFILAHIHFSSFLYDSLIFRRARLMFILTASTDMCIDPAISSYSMPS